MANDCEALGGWVGGEGGSAEPKRRSKRSRSKVAPAAAASARAFERASRRARYAHRVGGHDIWLRLSEDERRLFAARLIEAMRRGRVSVTRLGPMVGLSRSSVGMYISDKSLAVPKAGTLAKLAAALGCSADWLAAASDEPGWTREPTPPKAAKPRLPRPTDIIIMDAQQRARFALRLREAIDRSGLAGISLVASTGTTSIWSLCTGAASARRGTVARLAEALGCSEVWLGLTSDEPGWLSPPVGRKRPHGVHERRAIERLRAIAEGK